MKKIAGSILLLLSLTGCSFFGSFSEKNASGFYASDNEQCVPYARRLSGIQIFGNAGDWWDKAPPRYARGSTPVAGSVLVLKKTNRLPSGHVAVVKDVLGSRQISVSHSNWGNTTETRRIVYESMLAEDASPEGNWTQVRFWNKEHDVLGAAYPAYGFIYP